MAAGDWLKDNWQILAGLGMAAGGSYLNARQGNKAAAAQNAYGVQQAEWLRGLMGGGPSELEKWGIGQLNTGQDGLSQSLRTDSARKSEDTLRGIIGNQGNPFDASGLFDALAMLDARGLEGALATGRSAAPGLGQRFGSAQMRADNQTRRESAETASARNAGISMQSQGEAQQRVMQALGMLTQMDQFGQQLGAQNQLGILQALLGAQAQRGAVNANLGAMAACAGAPVSGPGYGNVLGGLGQLALLTTMSQQPQSTAVTPSGYSMGPLPSGYGSFPAPRMTPGPVSPMGWAGPNMTPVQPRYY